MVESAITLTKSSQRPPIKPDEKPSSIPISIPVPAAITPILSVLGVPTIKTANISRPLLSVPNGCSRIPFCFLKLTKPYGGKFNGELDTTDNSGSHANLPKRTKNYKTYY